jgi:hypothetical protein
LGVSADQRGLQIQHSSQGSVTPKLQQFSQRIASSKVGVCTSYALHYDMNTILSFSFDTDRCGAAFVPNNASAAAPGVVQLTVQCSGKPVSKSAAEQNYVVFCVAKVAASLAQSVDLANNSSSSS